EVSDGAGEPLIILGKEAKPPEPIVPEAGDAETAANGSSPAPEPPEEAAPYAAPELLHEPEPLPAPSQKEGAESPGEEDGKAAEDAETSFGVFDVGELIDAVERGEVDGERLREASEILAEMSGKTEEMQRLAERVEEAVGETPQSLDRSIRRHNGGGSCPRCNGGNRNGPRR
ncbi:MAG: hypothetical protein NC237_04105, partial [Eubacterium sp.]|nr:hypothetical protein [Eubacterium sp.]